MRKNIAQWLSIYLFPYFSLFIINALSGTDILFWVRLGDIEETLRNIFMVMIASPFLALLGYTIGFSSSTPLYTTEFKSALFACLIVSVALFIFGITKRKQLWGKIINAIGFYLWCIGGIISAGASA